MHALNLGERLHRRLAGRARGEVALCFAQAAGLALQRVGEAVRRGGGSLSERDACGAARSAACSSGRSSASAAGLTGSAVAGTANSTTLAIPLAKF